MQHVCHVDGNPCEVVQSLRSRLPRKRGRAAMRLQEALESVSDCLPCERCREAEQACASLPGTRLGKHERNILLYAPGPEEPQGAILDPDLRTHAERETYLRAIRKLARIGLLRVGTRFLKLRTNSMREDGETVRRAYAHRTMQLTELGRLVREAYGYEMDNDRPIRWTKHLKQIAQQVRLDSQQLLQLYLSCLADKLEQFSAYDEQDTSDEARRARKLLYLLGPVVERGMDDTQS